VCNIFIAGKEIFSKWQYEYIPKKLHKGSNIRVIAPSSSMAIILEKIGKFLMNGLHLWVLI